MARSIRFNGRRLDWPGRRHSSTATRTAALVSVGSPCDASAGRMTATGRRTRRPSPNLTSGRADTATPMSTPPPGKTCRPLPGVASRGRKPAECAATAAHPRCMRVRGLGALSRTPPGPGNGMTCTPPPGHPSSIEPSVNPGLSRPSGVGRGSWRCSATHRCERRRTRTATSCRPAAATPPTGWATRCGDRRHRYGSGGHHAGSRNDESRSPKGERPGQKGWS
jgi:hypothetical protein